MSSHRRILAWEKDLRTKNARQLVILAYFLVHITQQNKCVPSLPTLIHSHATGCRLNVTDTQMHRNGMPHSTDWDPRAGKEGSPGSLEAWPGGKPAKPSAWGKLWWGEAQQGWNIMECHGIYIYIHMLEYPSGSMLFYFFHGRIFTLWICIRFEDVSKKVSKKDDQRGCGSVFLGFFLDFLNLSVFCKYSWEILMIHGKIMENPHKMYWCLYIQDFPWPDWITDGLRFHTWRGCLGPPWDCDGADWQVLQGEQAPGLKEIAARKELDGWTSRVQSLLWLNTL